MKRTYRVTIEQEGDGEPEDQEILSRALGKGREASAGELPSDLVSEIKDILDEAFLGDMIEESLHRKILKKLRVKPPNIADISDELGGLEDIAIMDDAELANRIDRARKRLPT